MLVKFSNSSLTVRLFLLSAFKESFLKYSIMMAFDNSLFPSIKLLSSHKKWALSILCGFISRNILHSLTEDDILSSDVTSRKSSILALDTLMC